MQPVTKPPPSPTSLLLIDSRKPTSPPLAKSMSEIMEALQSKIRASRIKTEELNAQRAKTKEDIEKCHEVKELSRVQRRMEIEEEAGGIKKEDAGMKERGCWDEGR